MLPDEATDVLKLSKLRSILGVHLQVSVVFKQVVRVSPASDSDLESDAGSSLHDAFFDDFD